MAGRFKRKYRRKRAGRKGRKKALRGGSRKRAGMAIVKSPSEFIPDRLFCPMKWASTFDLRDYGPGEVVTDSVNGDYAVFRLTLYTDGYEYSPTTPAGQGLMMPNYNFPAEIQSNTINKNRYNRAEQLLQLYRCRRIKRSSVKLDLIQDAQGEGATSVPATIVCCYPMMSTAMEDFDPNTYIDSMQTAMQQPFSRHLNYGVTKTGNKALRNSMTVSKLFGISELQRKADPSYYAELIPPYPGGNRQTIGRQIVWQIVIGIPYLTTSPAAFYTDYKGTIQLTTMYEFFGKAPDLDPSASVVPPV